MRKIKGNGKGITFLRDHIGFEGDECLIWPFCRGAYGYGTFGFFMALYTDNGYWFWLCGFLIIFLS